ncbi:cytochrome P450 [Favolaschia claudopus]|uniref:Cytochrome P450 n=1 Tax=Favolaschia claudopus TaxID=2862362 RepID=A0AAV9ZQ49_9AGAR
MLTLDSPSTIVFAAALCVLWLVSSRLRVAKSLPPLPPGPRKWPLVGNLFSLTSRPWEPCMQWSREYNSDIIHLNLAGTSVIVLSSLGATDALLEKRSAIYSDRPPAPMAGDLMGWKFLFVLMNYGKTNQPHHLQESFSPRADSVHPFAGDEWRTHRRLFNQELNLPSTKREIRTSARVAAHALLRRLLDGPEGYRGHLHRFAGEIIISLTYGADAVVGDAPYIALAEQAAKSVAGAMVPGRFLVDVLPLLRYIPEWFPGAGFQSIAREGKKLAEKTRDVPFTDTKRKMEEGTAQPCFTVNALQALDSSSPSKSSSSSSYYDESTVKNVAAVMYIAGVDTITTTLTVFILAMVLHPEVLKKAQGEVDAVLKRKGGELPDFDDEEALPYVAAVVREVLRWRPTGPIAVPHRLSTDDEYQGYHLPAGSLVIGNAWAILRDEKLYGSNTEAFKPERFLLDDGALNKTIPHPETSVFGFGRRVCPGRHVAMSAIWIAVVSMLATLDLGRSMDEKEEGEEPDENAFEGGILFAPLPFKCSIMPRSKEAVELVRDVSGFEH